MRFLLAFAALLATPALAADTAFLVANPAAPPSVLPSVDRACTMDVAARQASQTTSDRADELNVRGDASSAMGLWRTAVLLDACNGSSWANLGTALVAQGNAADGLVAAQAAIRLDRGNVTAWIAAARALEAQGPWKGALKAWQEVLVISPENFVAEDGLRRAARASL
jgi:tetratricopeptide (TPR) repeat protein